jgi:hypothetical protein
MMKTNLSFGGTWAARSAQIGGGAAATIASLVAVTSGAEATVVSFAGVGMGTNGSMPISLAGSASPLYSIDYESGRNSSSEWVTRGTNCQKFGACQSSTTFLQTTTTNWNGTYFNAVSPDAWIGGYDSVGTMPSSTEKFTKRKAEIFYYGEITKDHVEYTAIPFTPHPDVREALYNKYLHLGFKVDGIDYIGAAKFVGLSLDSIEYEAVPGASAVPEPASWAMLIAGFGLTGAAMRRRRAAAQLAL